MTVNAYDAVTDFPSFKQLLFLYKNLVADMEVIRPEEVWVSDITYIGIFSKCSSK